MTIFVLLNYVFSFWEWSSKFDQNMIKLFSFRRLASFILCKTDAADADFVAIFDIDR